MNCNSNNLSIIQGDTLDVTLSIDNPETLDIESVKFVCKSLDVEENFVPIVNEGAESDDSWMMIIDANVTQNFRVGNYSYDITAVLDNGEVFTVVYHGNLEVLYKRI